MKIKWQNIPLWYKLQSIVALTSFITLVIAFAFVITYEYYINRHQLYADAQEIAEQVGLFMRFPLATMDKTVADALIQTLVADRRVESVGIYSPQGDLFVGYPLEKIPATTVQFSRSHQMQSKHDASSLLEFVHNVYAENTFIGTVYLKMSFRHLQQRAWDNTRLVSLVLLLGLSLVLLVTGRLQTTITKPVQNLVRTSQQVAEHQDFSVRATKFGNDELGQLTDAFNQMLNQLQQRDQIITQYHQQLEQQVQERTHALQEANTGLEREVSFRKNAEQALIETATFARNIVNHIAEALIVFEPNHKIKSVNPAVLQMLGYNEDELIGKPVPMLFAEQDRVFFESDWKEIFEEGALIHHDLYFRTRSDEKIPVALSGSVMRDAGDQTKLYLILARDVSITRQLISDLLASKADLEKKTHELQEATAQLIQTEKLSALGELVASVAHELNQPLNAIKIIAQGLTRDIQRDRFHPEELEPDLQDIVTQINRMAEIITHMRIFSRKQQDMPQQKIDPNQPITNILKLVGQQLRNHQIQLQLQIDQSLPEIRVDPLKLEQVLMNLILNARDALASGQQQQSELTIVSSLARSPQTGEEVVRIEVTDNGPGIPAELTNRVFDPFFTTKRPGQGTGLGLSISHKILAEVGGTLSFLSVPNQSTTFTITLPIKQHKTEKEEEV